MIVFRQVHREFPFLWESARQPAGRWHAGGEGPVHYFSDTPDGAWAELLRHEEIRDPEDLAGIRATLWAVEIDDRSGARPRLPVKVLTGGCESYPMCRKEAGRLRRNGTSKLVAPSAALLAGCARGWQVRGRLRPGPRRDGRVIVLFGDRPDLVGWRAVEGGRPDGALL